MKTKRGKTRQNLASGNKSRKRRGNLMFQRRKEKEQNEIQVCLIRRKVMTTPRFCMLKKQQPILKGCYTSNSHYHYPGTRLALPVLVLVCVALYNTGHYILQHVVLGQVYLPVHVAPELRCRVFVKHRLGCLLPTKENRVQSPAGLLPDFSKWETCRTMPLVGGFSWGSPAIPALAFWRCSIPHSTFIGSQDLVVQSGPNISTQNKRHFVVSTKYWDLYSGTVELRGFIRDSFHDEIDIKHVYTEVDFAIASQLIRHALDYSEPIADLQGKKWGVPYCNAKASLTLPPSHRQTTGWEDNNSLQKGLHLPAPEEPFVNTRHLEASFRVDGDAVAERLACSPPTRTNRIQSPTGALTDFRMGSPVSPALSFRHCSVWASQIEDSVLSEAAANEQSRHASGSVEAPMFGGEPLGRSGLRVRECPRQAAGERPPPQSAVRPHTPQVKQQLTPRTPEPHTSKMASLARNQSAPDRDSTSEQPISTKTNLMCTRFRNANFGFKGVCTDVWINYYNSENSHLSSFICASSATKAVHGKRSTFESPDQDLIVCTLCILPTNPGSPDFHMWESCRTMLLAAGFLGDLPFPLPVHSDVATYSPHFTLIGSQSPDFKTHLLCSTPPSHLL
ncbi:hypothetical protein PR048_017316 [Dryococelus australis]|uniref:Uncharacterized protein n=1 Tax=Dryococelus australis TaxID=614101 RepID=A0ABQ9H984_9NEOP|nr:hypothetical protein PR048_017316 [Dryococelus australis]